MLLSGGGDHSLDVRADRRDMVHQGGGFQCVNAVPEQPGSLRLCEPQP
jgi:hypothetical protein